MTLNLDRKSVKSVAVVALAGAVLAALIVFWQRDGGNAAPEQAAGKTAERHGAEEKHGGETGHDEALGIIAMSAQQARQAGIALAAAGPASVADTVRLPGEVRFNEDRTAHIVPRVAGVADTVSANLGQAVRKGQVLAVIASPELADLRSAALAADKRLALARVTYEREKKLWQDRISAEQDYLQSENALREAEIAAQTAGSKLTALGAGKADGALNRYVLRAPFDGIVVEKHIAQGEAVKEDANVFLLSDLSSVWVEIAVTPKDVETMRVGEAVTIRATATGTTAQGRIGYVGNLVGEQTRAATARAVIANPDMAWRPGLFVDVAAVRGEKQVPVAVQADAVQTLEDKPVVFVQAEGGFLARPVRTGASGGDHVEILAGLQAGERYVAKGSFVVKAQQGKSGAGHEH